VIREFEQSSESVQALGHSLDVALRNLGDVDNLLCNLQKRTESVCLRIEKLVAPGGPASTAQGQDAARQRDHPHSADP
jgi:hypothetical protein